MGALDLFRRRPAELVTRDQPPADRRDASAATQNLGYVTPGRATPPEWDAANAISWGYYGNVFVYACVQAIATDLAARKFRVGADPDKPNDFDTQAPLARLLSPPPGGPNRWTSARTLIAWSIAQRMVTGQFGWEIVTDRTDTPIEFWPLSSAWLRRIPSTSGARYFDGFEYGRPDDPKRLPVERVFYDWRPSQHDWREPESALRAARLDVSVAVMQDRYDYAFLQNDARPAAVVVHEAFAESGERDAWRAQFVGDHQGPDNAGRVAFAEAEGTGPDGVKNSLLIETLGLSQRDAQFIERYATKIRGMCVSLGVPLSRLMDASNRTFSNAGEEIKGYWRSTVFNAGQDFADAVNIQLVPMFGDDKVGWFDFSDVEALKPAPKFAQIDPVAAVDGGLATKNEGRQDLGLESVDGGDDLAEPAPPVPVPPKTDPSVEPVPAPEPRAAVGSGDGGQREPDPTEPTGPTPEQQAELVEQRRAKIWTSADAQVRALERSWERTFRRLFSRQADATIARLEGKRGRQLFSRQSTDPVDATTIFDPGFWTATTEEVALGLYEGVFAVGGARVSDLFGVAFDLSAPYAQDFINARANQLAGQVTSTTYDAVKQAMAEGVAAGESIPDLAARVRGVFDTASSARATTIARTEVISGFNGSSVAVASQLPSDVVGGQEWIATRDSRTRESHAEIDGARTMVGQVFDNGLAYPGDPAGDPAETVNCRCTIAFLTPDEMAERGGKPAARRMVSRTRAAAVLALIQPGRFDQRAVRAALEEIAA